MANKHSELTASSDLHVPKGFTEASPNTLPVKDSLGNLSWINFDEVGSSWHKGENPPTLAVGSEGDYYLETSKFRVYQRQSNVWVLVGSIRGTSWFKGNGAPTADLGLENDFYLDLTNSIVYQKSGIGWSMLLNIKGQQGLPGSTLGAIFYFRDLEEWGASYQDLYREPPNEPEVRHRKTMSAADGEQPVAPHKYLTEIGDPSSTVIPAGQWEFHIWTKVTDPAAGDSFIKLYIKKYDVSGVETVLFTHTTAKITSADPQELVETVYQPDFFISNTDRLVIEVNGYTTSPTPVEISFYHTGTQHYSHVNTPLYFRGARGAPGVGIDVLEKGDKTDGDVTVSANYTQLRPMAYGTLTINSGLTYNTNGWHLFAERLIINGTLGAPGRHASGATPGAGYASGTIGGSGAGGSGGSLPLLGFDVAIGGGGNGGAGGSVAGYAGTRGAIVQTVNRPRMKYIQNLLDIKAISGGGGGGSGGGWDDGYDSFWGGGGGGGGGVLIMSVGELVLNANAKITVAGGNGGNADGNYAGAPMGGGGGGGGGYAIIVCSSLQIDPTAKITAAGGLAGAGISGGPGGTAGQPGMIYLYNRTTGLWTTYTT